MGRITTHVLDTALGRPAAGMRVDLFRMDGDDDQVATATTNVDGRVDEPLIEGAAMIDGTYEIRFYAGAYLRANAMESTFLDVIPIRFSVASADEHYHVPLLLSPYGYSTYRGS